jgi:acyl-CoA thioesterase I
MMRTPIIVLLRAGGPGRCQGEWESRPGPSGVAWGGRAEGLKETVTEGVRALKAGGADVVLMDLQYAPIVLAASNHRVMQAIIAEVARQKRVGLFSRFTLMRRSIEAGLPAGALVSWDGLHNSTAGYDCVGRRWRGLSMPADAERLRS